LVDFFCFEGWIPERIRLVSEGGGETKIGMTKRDGEDSSHRAWDRLRSAHSFGDCLITISTGDLSELEEASSGLVGGHAYAVLDVVEGGDGLKLLKVKNPWGRKGWKGRFSPEDDSSARNPSFMRSIGGSYSSSERDNHRVGGIFWIEFGDAMVFFDNLSLNWNPKLFSHRSVLHELWPLAQGPREDRYSWGDNPQFLLEVRIGRITDALHLSSPSVWILLSRHISQTEREGEGVFMACHVANQLVGEAGRIFKPPHNLRHRCIYSNSQHILVRFDVDPTQDCPQNSDETKKRRAVYSLVVSQLEKSTDVRFSLQVFSTAPYQLYHSPPRPPYLQEVKGRWSVEKCSAGGSFSHDTYLLNPHYTFNISSPTSLHIELKCSPSHSCHIMVANGEGRRRERFNFSDEVISSGSYIHGCSFASSASKLPQGNYTIIVSLFQPNIESPFLLNVYSDKRIRINELIL